MNKYKIALYIRLSVDDKKSDSLSIVNQRKQLNSFVIKMDEYITNNIEVTEFIDNGYSGTNFERPKVQELLELVQNNKVDCIIVKDFSRFGRNSIETGYFIEKVFPTFNVRFISTSDNFDSINFKEDTGGVDIAFKYLVNEYYSKDLSMKIKSSIHCKMKKGEFISSSCIYGYSKGEGSHLVIDEEVADVVRQIFMLKCEAVSNTEIAKILNDNKVQTPGEYKRSKGKYVHGLVEGKSFWTGEKIRKILNNEMYTGCYIVNKFSVKEIGKKAKENQKNEWIRIPNHNPSIISEQIFLKAQNNMEKRLRKSNGSKKGSSYLLKSKINCGICGRRLDRRNDEPIFICRFNQEKNNFKCKDIRVFEENIENAIFTMMSKQAKIILDTEIDLNKGGIELKNIDLTKINEYEKEITYTENKKILLYERYLCEELSLIEYKTENASCDKKLLELKNICEIQKNKKNKLNEILTTSERMTTVSVEVLDQNKLTKKLVDLLIDRVVVFPNSKIEIKWKVEDFIKIK